MAKYAATLMYVIYGLDPQQAWHVSLDMLKTFPGACLLQCLCGPQLSNLLTNTSTCHAGIGLFLAFIGLQSTEGLGIISYDPATLVSLGGCPAMKHVRFNSHMRKQSLLVWTKLCLDFPKPKHNPQSRHPHWPDAIPSNSSLPECIETPVPKIIAL